MLLLCFKTFFNLIAEPVTMTTKVHTSSRPVVETRPKCIKLIILAFYTPPLYKI